MRVRAKVGTGLACAAALCLAPGPVDASCVAPSPEVIWSYPADGQAAIPTNAVFWILQTGFVRPLSSSSILLDGQPVPAGSLPFEFLPGTLLPNTAHTITIALMPGDPTAPKQEIHFTTGSGPAAAGSEPALEPFTLRTMRTGTLSALCKKALFALDCFDTGQDTDYVFETSVRPLAWIVDNAPSSPYGPRLWPGICGSPERYDNAFSTRCSIVTAVDEIGRSARSGPLCHNPSAGDAGAPSSDPGTVHGTGGGCSMAGPTALPGAPTGLLLLCYCFGRAGCLRARHRSTMASNARRRAR